MKKSLSLLVAIAMVFSMFATVVSAADTQQSAGEYLQKLGVIKGNQDGDLKEDQTWKRQDMIVLLSRLLGKEAEAKAAAKTHEFKDVTDKNYDGYISWAVEQGLVQGKGNGKFGFGDELKNQEFFALVLRAFGQEIAYDEVPAAAIKYGFATEETDMAAIPLRGATYDTIVTALDTEVPGTGKTLAEILGLVEAPAVSASQTGAKSVTVKFNKAVDPEKVKLTVKNGTSTREVTKTTYSEDKKSVVLEFATKLLEGASSVTATGVAEKDLVAEFTAAEEKITAIQFTSDKLAIGSGANNVPDYKTVSVGYKIVNQFEEDVTKSVGGSLTFQVGKPNVTATATNGVLKVTGGDNTTFQIGESVFVNAILNMNSYGITESKTFTVGQQAVVDSVEILSLYHPEDKELSTSSDFEEFYILVNAKDQYGNNVSLEQFKNGVFAVANNPMLFTVNKDNAKANVGPNRDKIGIPLTGPVVGAGFVFDGTNTVRITTLFGQKSDSIDIAVKKAPTVTNITLQQPDATVVPGATIKVPFEAYDQNGNKLDKYSDLNGKLTLSTSNGTFVLKQDYSNKKAILEWKVASLADSFLTANITGTSTISQLQVKVVAANDPRALAGLKDVKTSVIVGTEITIKPKNIIVKDQFDRNMKFEDLLKTHSVTISVYDGATYSNDPLVVVKDGVETSSGTLTEGSEEVVLKAKVKGTATVKLTLKDKDGKEISSYNNSAITVIASDAVKEDSYQVADIAKVQASDIAHGGEVKVTAKTSGGTELPLHKGLYTVNAIGDLNYDFASNKVYATSAAFDGSTDPAKTKKATYIVTILATGEKIEKEVTIVNEKSVPTSFELKSVDGKLTVSDGVATGAWNNVEVSTVFQTVKAKDQFGVEIAIDAKDFYANIRANDGVAIPANNGQTADVVKVGSVGEGKGYTVTFISKDSGKSIDVKVVSNSNQPAAN